MGNATIAKRDTKPVIVKDKRTTAKIKHVAKHQTLQHQKISLASYGVVGTSDLRKFCSLSAPPDYLILWRLESGIGIFH